MSLPKFVVEALLVKYTAEEVKIIDSNWFFYADPSMRFNSSSLKRILTECGIVLECALSDPIVEVK